ncbi:MAG: hypothetical protein JSR26_05240 [Proteobacteria bacterium]|nr:hypothetical protein [Pseudomonadota bacterium]
MSRLVVLQAGLPGGLCLIADERREQGMPASSIYSAIYLAEPKVSSMGVRYDPVPMPADMRASLEAVGLFVPHA